MSLQPEPKLPRVPELVGATGNSFQLTGVPTHIDLPVQEPTGPAALEPEELANWAPPRVFLNLERMIGELGAPPFSVYLNLPPGENSESHPELLAGDLPMFGLREASISDERHTPNGLYTQLDITGVYSRLALMDNWNPRNLRVTFVPKYPGKLPPVKVGRMSLYFA